MFKLVIADDEGKQTVVPLVRDEVTIRRKEGNTIRLTERNVSRRHARLMKANGKFVIEDLHSYNGFRVNGQRIGAETPLDAGDQITIGDYQLALQVDAAETQPEAASPALAEADTAMLAAPGPPARLVMITPPAPGAEFALTAERTRIGRAEDLDVWVNHRSISREHAEIQKEPDGGLRLIDLGSANGVRVNGEDVQNALLEPGDVVELGQVRFRFVAAGEHYAFDADRTVQMDAVSVGPAPASKAPYLVAIAIVMLAIIGAVLVAFIGGGGDSDPQISTDRGTDPAGSTADDRYADALSACQAAVEARDVAEALRQARTALEVRPGDEAATECQQRAQSSQSEQDTFDQGLEAFNNGELERAYFLFDSLPEDSPFRARPEVRGAVRSYASTQLTAGRAALDEGNASEAHRIALFVTNMHGLTNEQQAQAASLLRDAENAGATTEPAPVAVNDPPPTARGGRQVRNPTTRGGRRQPPGERPGQTTTTPRETPEETDTTPARPAAGDLDARVRQCVVAGDNACVIRLLEGHARTANQLAQLIEAYRARSQSQRAIHYMRIFVSRYSGHPRASTYRQILARQTQ